MSYFKSAILFKLPAVLLATAMLGFSGVSLRADEDKSPAQNAPQPPPPPEVFEEDNDIMPPPPPMPPRNGEGKDDGDAMAPQGQPRIHPRLFEYFKQLKESNPTEYSRLKTLQAENPEQFQSEINKLFLSQRKNRLDNKMRNYDRECWEIAQKLRTNPPPENAAELEAQLQEKIAQSFETMVEHTKKRLDALQKHLDNIQKERDNILKNRLEFFMNAPMPPENKEFDNNNRRGEFRRGNPPPPPNGEDGALHPPRRMTPPAIEK
jgi:hypothetical protein